MIQSSTPGDRNDGFRPLQDSVPSRFRSLPSIFDVMRDRYGIAARMEATSTLRLARLPGGLPISAQLPASRRPPLARRLRRSVRLALVAVDVRRRFTGKQLFHPIEQRTPLTSIS
jgi:hypothetical protein